MLKKGIPNLLNKTISYESHIDIFLNLPIDFPFDIDEIIIRYYGEDITVLPTNIPHIIKENIKSFYYGNITEFISFIEDNLETFLKNEIPTFNHKISRKPKLLTRPYKLPISHKTCTDLRIHYHQTNITLLSAPEIICDVQCLKCKQLNQLKFKTYCKKCGCELSLIYEPTMAVTDIGYLKLEGCVLLAVNVVYFIIVCYKCNSAFQIAGLVVDESLVFNCYKCFLELFIKVLNLEFLKYKKIVGKEIKMDVSGDGTCKHYKKSQRWFRFVCCGKLYPCDLCHDDVEDHGCEMAKKMVCGLCKVEQTVSNQCKCGMDVKRGGKQFWEGGKGTRNKVTMSKKDNKKYKK